MIQNVLKSILLIFFFSFSYFQTEGQVKKNIIAGFETIMDEVSPPTRNLYSSRSPSVRPSFYGDLQPLTLLHSDPRLNVQYFKPNKSIWIQGIPADLSTERNSSIESQAFSYLKACKKYLQIDNPESNFEIIESYEDHLGINHIRLQQTYKDVKVYGAELKLHGQDKISNLNGNTVLVAGDINPTPTLTDVDALAYIIEDLPFYDAEFNDLMKIFKAERSTSQLVIFPVDSGLKLCYHISIYLYTLHFV